ncbi:MAG: tetratricopeptide repeat protein [Acidobacteriota bacterium]|jgi:Flp pilus assembly protein TadD, contains TPR repeats|nr:tetratricopeptide repeat protein [Acidobacteriota bacterium]MDD8029547.1 tetratricopeptide repeat protein [Acidobacteriota bacterium]MDD8032280.1 tetratricopeptide repeat protein [Acidobacteriota bacterium]MDD8039106.1 tetratricopeptide repeat protein [Acidobacteriota bacterium]MDW3226212.1 tetratricopeptide repeat protein [Acidobacteriota bacterium]
MKKAAVFLSLSIFLASLFVFIADAQAGVQGTIKGVVKDKKGNVVEGVKITIVSLQYSAVKYTLKTNAKGEYFQIGLQPDYYQVKAEKDGFFPIFVEKQVRIQDVLEVNLELEEGNYYVGGESPGEKDFKQGNELFQAGKYEEAIAAYEAAIGKEAGEPTYLNNLGTTYMKIGNNEKAIATFTKMLEIQPESYSANKNLGSLFGEAKDYQGALPYYAKASELSPNDPDAFYNLGACYLNLQEYDKAEAAFLKVKELTPDYAPAYYQLGMIYVNQNKKPEAVENLERYIELAPDEPNADIARRILAYLK